MDILTIVCFVLISIISFAFGFYRGFSHLLDDISRKPVIWATALIRARIENYFNLSDITVEDIEKYTPFKVKT